MTFPAPFLRRLRGGSFSSADVGRSTTSVVYGGTTIPGGIEGFRHSLAYLVAIDRYGSGVPALRTPVADAEKVAEILRQDHGFKTEIVADERATLSKLHAFLKALPGQVGSDDRVLFYFAGHGIAIESGDGPKGYLLPQDADRNSTARYLPMLELNEALAALPCRHMLVILDCCFAGAFRWASTRDLILAPEQLHRERYAWFVRDAAWQAIASAAHDQKALDVAAGEALGARGQLSRHSPFAKALMDGLAGHADRRRTDGTGDGVITATELYLYLEEQLMPAPESGRPRQTPILWPLTKHDKGQFVFLVPGRNLDLPPAPPLDPDANPWRGLKPYESAHSDLFFGRRRTSEKLLERVLSERFVVVTGPSGIGKSSLVRAGLLPQLPDWIHPIVVRPGPTPFPSLAVALRDAGATQGVSPDEQALRANPFALTEWIKAQTGTGEFLLVVDQMEELITMSHDAEVARNYLGLIANALKDDTARLRILFTVRTEFEPQFAAQSPLFDRWSVARYIIPQMTPDELRRVIEGPATVKVIRFESDELIDKLVNEVVQMPGALPLLSFALSEMYVHYLGRRGDDRTLTYDDFDALEGGVTGSLQVRANHVLDGMDSLHQETARRLLERLVSVEAGEYARRRVPRRELESGDAVEKARTNEVVRRLDEARLIVTDEIDNEPYLELAHDALILGWERLVTWIRQDAPLIADLRRLTPDAEAWTSSPKDKAGLLWSDAARLATIKQLNATPFPGLNCIEHDFAKLSLRRARRNQVMRWSIAAALGVLTIYAFVQQAVATRQGWLALSRQLAAQAQVALAQRPDGLATGMLLAIEALKISDELGAHSLEADQALRTGLTLLPPHIATIQPRDGAHSVAFTPDSRYLITEGSRLSIYDTRDFREIFATDLLRAYGQGSFSRDKRSYARAINDERASDGPLSARVWNVFTGREVRTVKHDKYLAAVALSTRGDYLATGSFDRTARVWNVESGESIAVLPHGGSVHMVVFSPDDGYLATISGDDVAHVWMRATSESVLQLPHKKPVRQIAFSSDSALVATAGDDGVAQVWDLRDKSKKVEVGEPGHIINGVAFTSDGLCIGTAGEDGSFRVWDVATGRELVQVKNGAPAMGIAFSADDRYLIGGARIWEWRTGREVARTTWNAVSSPNGRYIAAASDGPTARIWRWPPEEPLLRLTQPGTSDFAVTDTPGAYLATGDPNGAIWDLAHLRKLTHIRGGNVVFSQDGAHLAGARLDAGAVVIKVGDTKEHCNVPYTGTAPVTGATGVIAVGLSADGSYLATLSDAAIGIELWDTRTCRFLARMKHDNGQGETTESVSFSPDATKILTAANGDTYARLWKVPSGEELHKLEHDSAVYAAAFSSGGQYMATASDSGAVCIWDVASGRKIANMAHSGSSRGFAVTTDGARAVAFSPDNKYVVSGALDGTAKVFEMAGSREVAQLQHDEGVRSVNFSLNGAFIATAGDDGFARIWEVGTWHEIARIGIGSPVRKVAFGAGDRYLVTASGGDGAGDIQTTQVWVWKTGDMTTEACARLPDKLSLDQWSYYLPSEPVRDCVDSNPPWQRRVLAELRPHFYDSLSRLVAWKPRASSAGAKFKSESSEAVDAEQVCGK